MIMSQKTQTTPKWLMASVVALSLGLVPLGVAYGQDFDAVGERLREAVVEGELSKDQARVMMDALRRSKGENDVFRRIREIEEAVMSGEISREEGARAIEETKRSMKDGHIRDRGEEREAYEARMRKIEAAVKAGKMSREEAAHAIGELMDSMEESDRARDRGDDRVSRGDLDLARFSDLFAQAESNFRRAIEHGDLSPVEVEALLTDLRIMIRLRPEYHDGHFDDEDFDEFLMEFFEDEEEDEDDDEDRDRRDR